MWFVSAEKIEKYTENVTPPFFGEKCHATLKIAFLRNAGV
jgi:hypothetical protein